MTSTNTQGAVCPVTWGWPQPSCNCPCRAAKPLWDRHYLMPWPPRPCARTGSKNEAAKPLEAAPNGQHHGGPNPKTATGSMRAARVMRWLPPVHWEHLMEHPWMGRSLSLALGQGTHLIASNSTVVRRGRGVDEKPALPPQRQEGRQWKRMLPHHWQALCLVGRCQPAPSTCRIHHQPGPGRSVSGYLTGLVVSQCLVVILIIYSRYYKSIPCEVSAVHGPVQTCSSQTPQTRYLAAKKHTANRSNERKGRGEKKISKKGRGTPVCFV